MIFPLGETRTPMLFRSDLTSVFVRSLLYWALSHASVNAMIIKVFCYFVRFLSDLKKILYASLYDLSVS